MQEEEYYIFKFTMIGDKGVGKTSLVSKFVGLKGEISSTGTTYHVEK